METPVLLILFNRPDKTKLAIEEIRKAKPKKLFVAADGPRTDHPEDRQKCEEARNMIREIDWPCEVRRNFSDANMGCDVRVPTAISWFFENVSDGIILEDDCLPETDFFDFCSELLDKYRNEPKIMMISGNNFQNGMRRGNTGFYFSRYANTWGWATWKRAWAEFQNELKDLDEFKKSGKKEKILSSTEQQRYWMNFFEKIRDGKYSFWDAKWTFSIWNKDGLCITPNNNLVDNIGQGAGATHTKDNIIEVMPPRSPLNRPLSYPETISVNKEADDYIFEHVYRISPYKKVRLKIASIFGL